MTYLHPLVSAEDDFAPVFFNDGPQGKVSDFSRLSGDSQPGPTTGQHPNKSLPGFGLAFETTKRKSKEKKKNRKSRGYDYEANVFLK